jgi:hypothetical protein
VDFYIRHSSNDDYIFYEDFFLLDVTSCSMVERYSLEEVTFLFISNKKVSDTMSRIN